MENFQWISKPTLSTIAQALGGTLVLKPVEILSKSGLIYGDIIMSICGVNTNSVNGLAEGLSNLAKLPAGAKAEVEYIRLGNRKRTYVQIPSDETDRG